MFERILLVYGNAAATAEDASLAAEGVADMAQQMRDTATAYKAAEATIWCRYVDWMVSSAPVRHYADDSLKTSRLAKMRPRRQRSQDELCAHAQEAPMRGTAN